jgi:hypothetical protein
MHGARSRAGVGIELVVVRYLACRPGREPGQRSPRVPPHPAANASLGTLQVGRPRSHVAIAAGRATNAARAAQGSAGRRRAGRVGVAGCSRILEACQAAWLRRERAWSGRVSCVKNCGAAAAKNGQDQV